MFIYVYIFCLIDFNGMLTCLGLFYAKKLENRFHCMFIFTFFLFV